VLDCDFVEEAKCCNKRLWLCACDLLLGMKNKEDLVLSVQISCLV
jgi:hypothetical protein